MLYKILKAVDTVVGNGTRIIAEIMHVIAAVCLALLVAGLAFSAFSRYVFLAPVPYTEEISSLLFVAVSFLGLGNIFLKGGHISFGGKDHGGEETSRPLRKMVGLVFTAMALGFAVAPTFGFADLSRILRSESDILEILLWPWMAIIPLGLFVLILAIAARLLALAVKSLEASHGKRI